MTRTTWLRSPTPSCRARRLRRERGEGRVRGRRSGRGRPARARDRRAPPPRHGARRVRLGEGQDEVGDLLPDRLGRRGALGRVEREAAPLLVVAARCFAARPIILRNVSFCKQLVQFAAAEDLILTGIAVLLTGFGVPYVLAIALWIIGIAGVVTVFQRMIEVRRQLRSAT